MNSPPAIGPKYLHIASLIDCGSHVLDVGCGGGQLGSAIKGKGCLVDGMDLKLDRLGSRSECYRNLYKVDVERLDFKDHREAYDVVVFSDVLEHLQHPGSILENAKLILRKTGKVIVFLPNVAYFSNRLNLLSGNWDYQDEGILDRTHLRFYTLSTAANLIETAGYGIERRIDEIPVIDSTFKRSLFAFLARRWPSVFSIGWVFHAVQRSTLTPSNPGAVLS